MRFVWITLFLAALFCIIAPLAYLYEASTLPQLESEFDLERYLRQYIEGERMAMKMARAAHDDTPVTYQRPEFAKFPKDLVALYINGYGCPTFFQTPRESGLAWSWRVFSSALFGNVRGGDGRCEWAVANNLAWAIHIRGGFRQAIAASKLHGFLQKDQLLAYDLSSLWFEPGLIGVDDASKTLFHKPLSQLKLEELAEFDLVLPPFSYWRDIRYCSNATMIRQNRNVILGNLAAAGLVPDDRAKAASAEPANCTNP